MPQMRQTRDHEVKELPIAMPLQRQWNMLPKRRCYGHAYPSYLTASLAWSASMAHCDERLRKKLSRGRQLYVGCDGACENRMRLHRHFAARP